METLYRESKYADCHKHAYADYHRCCTHSQGDTKKKQEEA